ncbi:MAG: hypothetical protein AB7G88_06515 [Thermomicrobiales bacterium]
MGIVADRHRACIGVRRQWQAVVVYATSSNRRTEREAGCIDAALFRGIITAGRIRHPLTDTRGRRTALAIEKRDLDRESIDQERRTIRRKALAIAAEAIAGQCQRTAHLFFDAADFPTERSDQANIVAAATFAVTALEWIIAALESADHRTMTIRTVAADSLIP